MTPRTRRKLIDDASIVRTLKHSKSFGKFYLKIKFLSKLNIGVSLIRYVLNYFDINALFGSRGLKVFFNPNIFGIVFKRIIESFVPFMMSFVLLTAT